MEINENNRKTKSISEKHKKKGPKEHTPRQLKKMFFDMGSQEFGLFEKKKRTFDGFLHNFEMLHAIATSVAVIERSFSLECRCLPHVV